MERGRGGGGGLHSHHEGNRLDALVGVEAARTAVVQQLEVGSGEAVHRAPGGIGDGDGRHYQGDAGAEGRLLLRRGVQGKAEATLY